MKAPRKGKIEIENLKSRGDARTQTVYKPITTVIHVGEGGSESKFWPCILKAARKGKIEFGKLKSGGDVVRSNTGWEDPVDASQLSRRLQQTKPMK